MNKINRVSATVTENQELQRSVEKSTKSHLEVHSTNVKTNQKLEQLSEKGKALLYETKAYKKAYQRIVSSSKEMDMPDSDWEQIKHVPFHDFGKIIEIASNKDLDGLTKRQQKQLMKKRIEALSDDDTDGWGPVAKLLFKIGLKDWTDLMIWFTDSERSGKKFLAGNYRDLDDFVIRESLKDSLHVN